jgi:GcrA cell cycle regulator
MPRGEKTGHGGIWTEENIELLKKLWADGLSASQIKSEIPGASRNAVMGKIHRLNLGGKRIAKPKPKATPKQGTGRPSAARKSEAPARGLPDPAPAPVESLNLPYSEIPIDGCSYATNDGATRELLFCGCKRKPGRPYCAYHARITSGGTPGKSPSIPRGG